MTVFVSHENIEAFVQKLEFWKTCICLSELDSGLMFKHCSREIDEGVNMCGYGFSCYIMKRLNI